MKYKITRLIDRPKMKEQAARWFHEKWGIPMEAYLESMEECLGKQNAVPQWYFVMDDEKIIAGLGVIENDFHDRKDLAPNVCAVYVEEKYRRQGIAGEMLNFVCTDMEKKGVDTLYLVTDHTSFYERYGWTFLCMVGEDGGPEVSRMYIRRASGWQGVNSSYYSQPLHSHAQKQPAKPSADAAHLDFLLMWVK